MPSVLRSGRRGDDARHPQAGVRTRPRPRRGSGTDTRAGRGPRPDRGSVDLRHRSPHPALGSVVVGARQASADARSRAVRDGRRGRERRARRRRGRLRLGREPRHLRRLLPLPHREGAHVRVDAHPRSRSRRRLRRVRGRARLGRVAERPLEASAGDRVPPGALRERGLRDLDAGSRGSGGRRARLRPGRASSPSRSHVRSARGACSPPTTSPSGSISRESSARRPS